MSTTTNAQRGDHRHPEATGAARTSTFGHGAAAYSGVITADGTQVSSDGESFDASEADENAALAENGGTLSLTGATLTKSGDDTNGDKTASDPLANGIIIYQSTSGDAESTTGETATFQAADSTLKSAITSGSMFYLTNTSADVVLARTSLDYDSGAADLIMAVGNDSNNWGTAGSNGATVRFTGIEQQLTGNIEADTMSSVDLHLTQGSIWTGSASITDNANGATSDAPITVNVDGTSSWVVTDSCTISALNVASGAQVVDENGNTVTIVAGGQTVVQGDSGVTVTCDSYSTDYDASEAGTLSDDLIDRSDFDEQMGTSTTWSMGDQGSTSQASATQATTSTQTQAETNSETSENPIIAFFQWLGGLLGF